MPLEYLEQLGQAKEDVQTISNDVVTQIMIDWANDAIQTMRANAPKASGALAASMQPLVRFEENVMVLEISGDDYWDFVNSGVDGVRQSSGAVSNKFGSTYSFKTESPSRKMIDALMGQNKQNWLASKGITTLTYTNYETGETVTKPLQTDSDYRAAAYVFARAVKRHGIKPAQFVEKAVTEESLQELENKILDAFANIL